MKKIVFIITLLSTLITSYSQSRNDSTQIETSTTIREKLKAFKTQPQYKLVIDSHKCEVDVFINGIIIKPNNGTKHYDLNHFITDKISSIKIIATPGYVSYPENGVITKRKIQSFRENSKLSAIIIEDQASDSLKTINTTKLVGSEPLIFQFKFDSKLPYYAEAWKNGVDFRKDEKVKTKIIALFDELGKAVLANDENTIDNLIYKREYAIQQLDFDTKIDTTKKLWKEITTLNKTTKNYSVTEDFDIAYYASGKLVYIQPKNNLDMLTFNGKTIDTPMSYLLCQAAGSNELKIIR